MPNKARTLILKVPLYLLWLQYFCLLPWQSMRAVNQQGWVAAFLYSTRSCFTACNYNTLFIPCCKGCFGWGTYKTFQNGRKESLAAIAKAGEGRDKGNILGNHLYLAQCKHPGGEWSWDAFPNWCGGTQVASKPGNTQRLTAITQHTATLWPELVADQEQSHWT